MPLIAIIQARMSSRRFPGKVLAPFMGKPVLAHVVTRIKACNEPLPVILATSDETSDDPLALYGASLGLTVVRGALGDVLGRFAQVLQAHPCEAFFRVCGDSPVLLPALFDQAAAVYRQGDFDLVTNVFPRTFPVGQSVELLRAATFLKLEPGVTEPADREHLTRFYYQHAGQFRIHNLACQPPAAADLRLAVDEVEDLQRIETWLTCSQSPKAEDLKPEELKPEELKIDGFA